MRISQDFDLIGQWLQFDSAKSSGRLQLITDDSLRAAMVAYYEA